MPLRSVLDGSGAFYLFALGTVASALLVLFAGISIGRDLERRRIQKRDQS